MFWSNPWPPVTGRQNHLPGSVSQRRAKPSYKTAWPVDQGHDENKTQLKLDIFNWKITLNMFWSNPWPPVTGGQNHLPGSVSQRRAKPSYKTAWPVDQDHVVNKTQLKLDIFNWKITLNMFWSNPWPPVTGGQNHLPGSVSQRRAKPSYKTAWPVDQGHVVNKTQLKLDICNWKITLNMFWSNPWPPVTGGQNHLPGSVSQRRA